MAEMFVPDYSDVEKMLIPDGNQHLNDLHLAKTAQSKQLASLYANNMSKTGDMLSFFEDGELSDSQMFDACVDKSLDTMEEFQSVYDDFKLK